MGSQPPPDRKLGESYTITGESLWFLSPGLWLDDAVVNTFLRALCLARPGECVTFDSAALGVLLAAHGSEETTQTALDELYMPFRKTAATVTGNRGLVFMPFCAANHWVLAVADFQKKVIRVYDSTARCGLNGKVDPSPLVQAIVQCVEGTLAFCIDEDQWQVEHMWLPRQKNSTDCGTYVCLMALQHACMPGFKTEHYVRPFCDWNENWSYYKLDACYWFVGRKIILEVCRRYFKPTAVDIPYMPYLVEQTINDAFLRFFGVGPVGAPISLNMQYFHARSWTLYRVINALTWAINSIHNLGSPRHIHSSESIQKRAREVVITPRGEPFLDEIMDEAVSYAWHDVEALQNLAVDLSRVRYQLHRQYHDAHAQLNVWAAQEAYWGENAEKTPSAAENGLPSSPDKE